MNKRLDLGFPDIDSKTNRANALVAKKCVNCVSRVTIWYIISSSVHSNCRPGDIQGSEALQLLARRLQNHRFSSAATDKLTKTVKNERVLENDAALFTVLPALVDDDPAPVAVVVGEVVVWTCASRSGHCGATRMSP